MSSLGHLRLASATLGSNSECQIYSNGVATFLVGNPTFTSNVSYPDIGSTTWSTDTGLNITSNSTPSEALSKIDCWLETYLLDAPPVLTSSSSTTAVEYIQVSWSNPTQRKLAFLSNTYVPQITKLRADVVPSGSSWTGGSQWTINLQTPTTTPTCTSLRIVLDYNSGTSTLSSGTYYFYGTSSSNRIAQATSYDVRVYAENEATLSGSKTPRYLVFSNLATLSAGTPSAPTIVSVSSISQTTATASWTSPSTPDTSSNATPYIQQYKVNVTANSSVRYGNVLTTQTTPQLTANATGSNASTSLGLTTLNPGTSYNITVQARNTFNTSFGNASSPATTFTTSYPTAPSWPTGSITLSNQASLIYGSGSTGYTLDGNTAVSPILNYNTMLTTPPVSSAVSNFRLNYTLADTASSTGSVEAHAGPGGSESTASVTTVGFGRTFTTGNTDVGAARLVFSAEGDAYSGSSSGFYKQGTVYIAAINPASYYPASNSAYRMYLKFLPTGGSTVTGGNVSFYVDRLNALPSVVGSGITTATSTTTYITGVPTFTSSTTFGFQTTVRSLAYQFLRSDKVHFTAQIETSSGTALSSTLSVTKSNVNGSTYSYYTATGDTYSLSATKHNTYRRGPLDPRT